MTGLLFVHVAIIPREQCADFLVRQNCVNQRAHDLLDVYELPGRRRCPSGRICRSIHIHQFKSLHQSPSRGKALNLAKHPHLCSLWLVARNFPQAPSHLWNISHVQALLPCLSEMCSAEHCKPKASIAAIFFGATCGSTRCGPTTNKSLLLNLASSSATIS